MCSTFKSRRSTAPSHQKNWLIIVKLLQILWKLFKREGGRGWTFLATNYQFLQLEKCLERVKRNVFNVIVPTEGYFKTKNLRGASLTIRPLLELLLTLWDRACPFSKLVFETLPNYFQTLPVLSKALTDFYRLAQDYLQGSSRLTKDNSRINWVTLKIALTCSRIGDALRLFPETHRDIKTWEGGF